jgi:NodT family efflux transporter outer membrane factor (OMF) lipoprotein
MRFSVADLRIHSDRDHMPPASMSLRFAVFLFSIWLVVGCVAPDKPIVPPVEVTDGFRQVGGLPLPDQWWRSFDDPILDGLIEEALTSNFDLKTAWDRLRQARASARAEAAALIPELQGSGGVTRSRRVETNDNDFDFADTTNRSGTTIETNYSLGLSASYELDLWGRVRSARDAAVFDAKASAEAVQTAALTLSASVADTWYQLVEQNAQIDLLESQLELNAKVTELVTARFRQGQVGSLDVLQQQQLEESRRGDLALARARAAIFEHQLAILLGQPPTRKVAKHVSELRMPGRLPATGVPGELVQRRPDIRAAYYDVLASDRRVSQAVADRFPRISLTAGVDADAPAVRDLLDNYLATMAANLVAPLIDGGARAAEVRRTEAVLSEQINRYGQTILEAFGEVEDALVQEARQREYLASLEKQLELSSAALRRIRQGYLQGTNDYLRVLDGISTDQELQRAYLAARRELIQQRIALCRALGGGWEMKSPPLARLVVETKRNPTDL